jgi:hypothetical protein
MQLPLLLLSMPLLLLLLVSLVPIIDAATIVFIPLLLLLQIVECYWFLQLYLYTTAGKAIPFTHDTTTTMVTMLALQARPLAQP